MGAAPCKLWRWPKVHWDRNLPPRLAAREKRRKNCLAPKHRVVRHSPPQPHHCGVRPTRWSWWSRPAEDIGQPRKSPDHDACEQQQDQRCGKPLHVLPPTACYGGDIQIFAETRNIPNATKKTNAPMSRTCLASGGAGDEPTPNRNDVQRVLGTSLPLTA